MIRLGAGPLDRIVAVGAHCDDIAIGAGGTLLALCRARPGAVSYTHLTLPTNREV